MPTKTKTSLLASKIAKPDPLTRKVDSLTKKVNLLTEKVDLLMYKVDILIEKVDTFKTIDDDTKPTNPQTG